MMDQTLDTRTSKQQKRKRSGTSSSPKKIRTPEPAPVPSRIFCRVRFWSQTLRVQLPHNTKL
ncbi:hypothetical protein BDU57DRAFT_516863, partial [Ampelomyces quisqualis]